MSVFTRTGLFALLLLAAVGQPWPLTDLTISLILFILSMSHYLFDQVACFILLVLNFQFRLFLLIIIIIAHFYLKLAEVFWVDDLLFQVFEIGEVISYVFKLNLLRIFRWKHWLVILILTVVFHHRFLLIRLLDDVLDYAVYAIREFGLFAQENVYLGFKFDFGFLVGLLMDIFFFVKLIDFKSYLVKFDLSLLYCLDMTLHLVFHGFGLRRQIRLFAFQFPALRSCRLRQGLLDLH